MADRYHSILLVESQPTATLGLRAIIRSKPIFELKAVKETEDEAVEYLEESHRTVGMVLTGLLLGAGGYGIDLVARISARWPDLRIVLMSAIEEDSIARQAERNGAIAVVSKMDRYEVLVAALTGAAAGRRFVSPAFGSSNGTFDDPLSERQRAVLQMLAQGMRTAEIAANLGLGEETVRTHIKAAVRKLGATDRTQAVAIALRHGLID